MSTRRYFEILGIPPTKNEKIIKKAYRKKALEYHPDRNPSAAAKDKFIQVTNAYDHIIIALEQAKKPRNTTFRQTNTTQRQQTRRAHTRPENNNSQRSKSKTEREERLKEAQQRYENMKRKEAQENERYYRNITTGSNWKRFKIIMLICALFSLFMTLDMLFLPTQTIATQIIKKNDTISYSGIYGNNTSPVEFLNAQKAWIDVAYIKMEESNYLYLERTLFFKDIKYVKYWKDNKWNYYTPDYSFMSTYPLTPILLLLPLLTYYLKRKTIYFSLLYHTSIYIIPIFLLIFIVSNDRWAHLLTLGLMG